MKEPIFFSVPHDAYDILRKALEQADLPTSDLEQPNRMFFGLSDQKGLIGYVGLEGDGADRLVRSLVILPSRRGSGHGGTLVRKLEAILPEDVERLHLLTRTATSFFRRLGYVDSDRLQFGCRRFDSEPGERGMDIADQQWEIACRDIVVGNMRRHDIGGEREQCLVAVVGHMGAPFRPSAWRIHYE